MWNIGIQTQQWWAWSHTQQQPLRLYDSCTHAALPSFTFFMFYTLTINSLSFCLSFSLSFSVCIPSVRSSQQFRDTQCCWTGQCHRGAGEEQDGEMEIINKAHKYLLMCHICARNISDRFMHKQTHIHTHTLFFFWCCWQRMASWPTSHLSGLWLTMPAVYWSNKWTQKCPTHTCPLAYIQYSTDAN